MSRRQWGHGFHTGKREGFEAGVRAAISGQPLIEIESRLDRPGELAEMYAAASELYDNGLWVYVAKLWYDSKADHCTVTLRSSPFREWERDYWLVSGDILRVLTKHLSQFEWRADDFVSAVYHGRPPPLRERLLTSVQSWWWWNVTRRLSPPRADGEAF